MARRSSTRKVGPEKLDPQPIAIPARIKRAETIADQVRRLVTSERIKQDLHAAELETFEEASDFDVDDDADFVSPWEEGFYGEFEVETERVLTARNTKRAEAEKAAAAEADQKTRDIVAEVVKRLQGGAGGASSDSGQTDPEEP